MTRSSAGIGKNSWVSVYCNKDVADFLHLQTSCIELILKENLLNLIVRPTRLVVMNTTIKFNVKKIPSRARICHEYNSFSQNSAKKEGGENE